MAYFETVLARNDAFTIREHKPYAPYKGEVFYTIEITHGSQHHSLDHLRALRTALNEALDAVIPHDVEVSR